MTFPSPHCFFFFFFNDTATTEIYTLSLHDALPICRGQGRERMGRAGVLPRGGGGPRRRCVRHPQDVQQDGVEHRSEEHTSELQSRLHLVCRLLLEKKKKKKKHEYGR